LPHKAITSSRVAELALPVVLAAVVALVGFATMEAGRLRQVAWSEARDSAERAAEGLQSELTRLGDTAGAVLARVATQLVLPEVQALPPDARHRLLFAPGLSGLDAVLAVGADGRVLLEARSEGTPAPGLDHDGLLRAHAGSTSLVLRLGDAGDPAWIAASHRMQDPAGRFIGMVATALPAERLGALLARWRPTPGATISLLGEDGMRMLHLAPEGAGRQAVATEGRALHVARPAQAMSATLLVSVPAADLRSAWLAIWLQRAAPALAGAGALLLLALLLRRTLAGHRVLAAEAIQREAEFRLLTENCEDLITRVGPDGLRRYASPAAWRLLGQAPEDMVGQPAEALAHPEDRAELAAAAAQVLAGRVDRTAVEIRVLRPDGEISWVEEVMRGLRNPHTGASDGYVSLVRDINHRRRREEDLARQASSDPLTGVLNRAGLDTELARSCVAAALAGAPVSLLLVDVDHFKRFNDGYGHPAGDGCLVQVAGAIRRAAQRGRDVVGRYGGEEFAVLLPDTEHAQAALVAERIRAAVEAMAIPHEGSSLPQRVVSVSIGVATIYPSPEHDLENTVGPLVKAADLRLYEAKAAGRNRIAAAGNEATIRAAA
jgi:diguanylate cyclase (GGDEF)-like protein/PAS domain S-box-containing protein